MKIFDPFPHPSLTSLCLCIESMIWPLVCQLSLRMAPNFKEFNRYGSHILHSIGLHTELLTLHRGDLIVNVPSGI